MVTGPMLVEPLTNHIGALVHDLDLSQLPDADVSGLKHLLNTHLVLFFRQQHLDPGSLLRLAKKLGTPVPYPFVNGLQGFPEVIEVVKRPEDRLNFGGVWHSDTAYLPEPAMGALLYAVQVPSTGGDTLFADMYKVYESLSPGLRSMLAGLNAVNSSDKDGVNVRPGHHARGLVAEHPVIRTHPVTGRKLLYVNRAHSTRFSGMSEAESRPLLEYLFRLIEQPEFSCRWSWNEGSLALWDNRCCQHYPLNDYPGENRRMIRVSLRGDQPR